MLSDVLRRLIGDKKREPARLVSRLGAIAVALVGFLALWGLDLGPEWVDRIQGTIAFVVPALVTVGEFIRPYVASSRTVATAVADAKLTHPETPTVPNVDLPGYQAAVRDQLRDKDPGAFPPRFVPLNQT